MAVPMASTWRPRVVVMVVGCMRVVPLKVMPPMPVLHVQQGWGRGVGRR